MSRPKRRLVQHQQSRVDGHHQREVQLRHHALRELPDLAGALDGGLGEKAFRLGTIEPRMHAGDVVEQSAKPDPARQHGDVGDEADVAHELIALVQGSRPEHLQLSLVRSEPEDRVERRRLAGAVGTDESDDAALFHAASSTPSSAMVVPKALRRPRASMHAMASALLLSEIRPRRVFDSAASDGAVLLSAVQKFFRPSGRAAESWRGSWATLRRETSAVRPAATDCVRQH